MRNSDLKTYGLSIKNLKTKPIRTACLVIVAATEGVVRFPSTSSCRSAQAEIGIGAFYTPHLTRKETS